MHSNCLPNLSKSCLELLEAFMTPPDLPVVAVWFHYYLQKTVLLGWELHLTYTTLVLTEKMTPSSLKSGTI